MAIKITPNVRTIVTGDNVTPYDETTEFDLAEKIETNLYVNSTADVSVPYSNIDNISVMLFHSDDDFTINITMTIDSTSVTVPIATTGNFRLDPTSAFVTAITAITLSSTSTDDIEVQVCIYGVESDS